jgi:hypothetical protein
MAEDEGGTRNPLVVAAEAVQRERAIARGYLKKRSSGKNVWQRRFFMVLPGEGGAFYLAYAKTPEGPILASMDLAQAGAVHAVEGDGLGCQFGLQWDKHRVFSASSADECMMWVNTIRKVQAERKRGGGGGGGGGGSASGAGGSLGSAGKDWGAGKRGGEGRAGGSSGGSCCSVQ